MDSMERRSPLPEARASSRGRRGGGEGGAFLTEVQDVVPSSVPLASSSTRRASPSSRELAKTVATLAARSRSRSQSTSLRSRSLSAPRGKPKVDVSGEFSEKIRSIAPGNLPNSMRRTGAIKHIVSPNNIEVWRPRVHPRRQIQSYPRFPPHDMASMKKSSPDPKHNDNNASNVSALMRSSLPLLGPDTSGTSGPPIPRLHELSDLDDSRSMVSSAVSVLSHHSISSIPQSGAGVRSSISSNNDFNRYLNRRKQAEEIARLKEEALLRPIDPNPGLASFRSGSQMSTSRSRSHISSRGSQNSRSRSVPLDERSLSSSRSQLHEPCLPGFVDDQISFSGQKSPLNEEAVVSSDAQSVLSSAFGESAITDPGPSVSERGSVSSSLAAQRLAQLEERLEKERQLRLETEKSLLELRRRQDELLSTFSPSKAFSTHSAPHQTSVNPPESPFTVPEVSIELVQQLHDAERQVEHIKNMLQTLHSKIDPLDVSTGVDKYNESSGEDLEQTRTLLSSLTGPASSDPFLSDSGKRDPLRNFPHFMKSRLVEGFRAPEIVRDPAHFSAHPHKSVRRTEFYSDYEGHRFLIDRYGM